MTTTAQSRLEMRIARKCVQALLATYRTVDVFDGEETTVRNSRKLTEIMAALATTDEDYLRVSGGWVRLIWGNGEDLISDYSIGMEEVMAPVCAYAEGAA